MSLAKRGIPVQVLSIEMTKESLLARIICSEGRVPTKYFLRRELTAEQRRDTPFTDIMRSEGRKMGTICSCFYSCTDRTVAHECLHTRQ
jgi:hypothetical protein